MIKLVGIGSNNYYSNRFYYVNNSFTDMIYIYTSHSSHIYIYIYEVLRRRNCPRVRLMVVLYFIVYYNMIGRRKKLTTEKNC